MSKTITVVIENGSAKIETDGFVGKACADATAALEQAMGVVTDEVKKPEFHQREVQSRNQ